MAKELAIEFAETESPALVRFVEGTRMAHEVYNVLFSEFSKWVAILFAEYWRSYKITGNIPEARVYA